MSSSGNYQPRAEDKFSFGLWTVGNRGRDAFGDAVRPTLPPNDIVARLAEVGAWGVNLHDNDLVPIDATPAERDRVVGSLKKASEKNVIVVPMATISLCFHTISRHAPCTTNDPEMRPDANKK